MSWYSGRLTAILRINMILFVSMLVSTSRSGPLLDVMYVMLESLCVVLLLIVFLMAVENLFCCVPPAVEISMP